MSVVWRHAVSRFGRAAGARLGPYEPVLREMIFNPVPGAAEPMIAVARREKHLDGRAIPFAVDPHIGKYRGRNYWRFHISAFEFWMKLDAMPHHFPDGVLANGRDPLLVCDLGPEDIRGAPQYQKIFARMGAK